MSDRNDLGSQNAFLQANGIRFLFLVVVVLFYFFKLLFVSVDINNLKYTLGLNLEEERSSPGPKNFTGNNK